MLKMNLEIEILYCPIMMPPVQDLELLPLPRPDASAGSHPAPMEVRQMSDLLSCPPPMLPWDEKIGSQAQNHRKALKNSCGYSPSEETCPQT